MSYKHHKCIECENIVVSRGKLRCKTCANRMIARTRKTDYSYLLGEKNHNFKGVKQDNGYTMIYSPQHPQARGKYVRKCNLIMEKKIGRIIDKKVEVVHHINSDRSDDRIENLILMGRSEHCSYHANKNFHRKGNIIRSHKSQTSPD